MTRNRFYDLPDELQAEIYKKVFNNVIKELTSIINIKHISMGIIKKKEEIFDVVDFTIFSHLVKLNRYLYKLSVEDALCFEKVFKILFAYYNLKIFQDYYEDDEILLEYKKQIYWNGLKYGNIIDIKYTYRNENILYKMVYNWYYGQTKDDIYRYLYDNKHPVPKGWTKKRLIKECMKM